MTLTPEVLVIALEASAHRLETEFTAEQLREIIRSTHGKTRVRFPISGNKRALALRIVSLRHTLNRIARWGAAAE